LINGGLVLPHFILVRVDRVVRDREKSSAESLDGSLFPCVVVQQAARDTAFSALAWTGQATLSPSTSMPRESSSLKPGLGLRAVRARNFSLEMLVLFPGPNVFDNVASIT
jgi:hypothetical protein